MRELADGQAWTVDRERRQHDVDAGAVAQPRVAHRRALVDAPADRADDAVDHLAHLTRRLEDDRAQADAAASLDEDLVRPVDHDLGHGRIFEQTLQYAQAQHLVEQRVDEMSVLETVERQPIDLDVLVGDAVDPRPHALAVGDVDLVGVLLHQLRVDGGLGGRKRGRQPAGLLLRCLLCGPGCRSAFRLFAVAVDDAERHRCRDGFAGLRPAPRLEAVLKSHAGWPRGAGAARSAPPCERVRWGRSGGT